MATVTKAAAAAAKGQATAGAAKAGPISALMAKGPAAQFGVGAVVSVLVMVAGYGLLRSPRKVVIQRPAAEQASAEPVAQKPEPKRRERVDDPLLRPFELPAEKPREGGDLLADVIAPSEYVGRWTVQGREAGRGRYEGELTIEHTKKGTHEVRRVVTYENGTTVRWTGELTEKGKAVNFAYSIRTLKATLSMTEPGEGAPKFVKKKLSGRFTVHDGGKVLRGYLGSGGELVEVLRRVELVDQGVVAEVSTGGGAAGDKVAGMVDNLETK